MEAECCVMPLPCGCCSTLPACPLSWPSFYRLQLLNVAYARHEIVSDTTDVTLEWLEAGGAKAGLPGVLQAR